MSEQDTPTLAASLLTDDTQPAQTLPFPEMTSTLRSANSYLRTPFALAPTVLLIGTDPSANKWAEKWLNHEGLIARPILSVDVALRMMAADPTCVAVIDATLADADGRAVYEAMNDDPRAANIPKVILCQTQSDVERALDAGVADIMRTPVDWNVVGRRVSTLARFAVCSRDLENARDELRRTKETMEVSRLALSTQGDTDKLTGLPSLAKFRDILARALCQTDELALFLIGLERFHVINEAHSRETGDRGLQKVLEINLRFF